MLSKRKKSPAAVVLFTVSSVLVSWAEESLPSTEFWSEETLAEDIEELPESTVQAVAEAPLSYLSPTLLPTTTVEAEGERGEATLLGSPLAENPLLRFASPSATVLRGAPLRRKQRATLGETLAAEPGITASSYSPGVSRPIIRGFDGVRVRTLRDGLGTMDLSEDSPDHGVLIDPLMMEEVEIHRGPSSLLFGNSAIGGAINTRTRTIPAVEEGEPFTATAMTGYESQGDGHHFATAGEFRNEQAALGFSASHRSAGDISIPGRARSQAYESLVQPHQFVPGVGAVPVSNSSDTLPNSFHNSTSWTLGGRLGSEDFLSLGVSHHRFETNYGLPYFYPGDETDFFGDYDIAAHLDRSDLEVSYRGDGGSWLREARWRLGYGNYGHDENFSGQGKDQGRDFTGTTFQKTTWESRLELHHGEEADLISGIWGAHFSNEELALTRLLVPPPTAFCEDSTLASTGLGFFALEQWQLGAFTLQGGLRWDQLETSLTDQLGSTLRSEGGSFSQSLTLSYDHSHPGPLDHLTTSLTISRLERQPTAHERYAFFHNAALGRFLIGGDLDGDVLKREESTGVELSFEGGWANTSAGLNLFYYDFANYVFLQDQRGVSFAPTAQYVETAAEFYGLEVSIDHLLCDDPGGWGLIQARLTGDLVRGLDRDRDDSPLPRIPPARLGAELTWELQHWRAALDMRYVFAQREAAEFPVAELESGDYLMVNASLNWTPDPEIRDWEISLQLRNLLDQEARDHTSFRKDTTPLPGFGLSSEVRWVF
ncbi:TonB-dependent receptor [Roseibacillus ishigakijimensis]|uniref:TonB-dependent receptor n=1 Tax=Roseibacillus ishigakijimensis TaxID=454146 RepID=A0A934VJR0_9BACT|nr:TonB-dependent receptor [Roseibacillus ishigakijimensis]MBK1832864.1 TonB-dependent receptor [Roseibacillus ishigakijimensis]